MKPEILLNRLKKHKKAGIIDAVDFEFTHFLYSSHSQIAANVLLAACLASYFYRQGNVCLILDDYDECNLFAETETSLQPLQTPNLEQWKKELADSPIVGAPGEFKPLLLDNAGRLYLHKLWTQERSLADNLLQKQALANCQVDYEKLKEGLERLFPDVSRDIDWQKIAAAAAILQPLVLISGGPGTGKTRTVIRILALLLEQLQQKKQVITIALAAPTGKAAARLNSSIYNQKELLNTDPQIIGQLPDNAVTVHKLLGARLHSDTYKFNKDNKLPCDLIIVDEVSMVDQRLMNSLLLAMKPTARLILLGDKDQLASVEAGSVLGDICKKAENKFSASFFEMLRKLDMHLPPKSVTNELVSLNDNIVLLERNYRFAANSGIMQLISNIKKGAADKAISLLKDVNYEDIELRNYENFDKLWENSKSAFRNYFDTVEAGKSISVLLGELQQFKILCAHRTGPFGVENLYRQIEQKLRTQKFIKSRDVWYEGRPVIIRKNNYHLQLRNGDIGICRKDEHREWTVCFSRKTQTGNDEIVKIHPERLPLYEAAYALTIHQSQGSEFDEVMVVLPNYSSKILNRELLYTAVSRARKKVSIIAKNKIIKQTINSRLSRKAGLADYLWCNE